MENEVVVVRKSGRVWKILGILLAIGGLCLVAVKIYKKFFRKNKPALEDVEDIAELEELELEEPFEASADDVIVNAAELDA